MPLSKADAAVSIPLKKFRSGETVMSNRKSSNRRVSFQRKLRVEGLERRALLAGDCFHNIVLPEDTDGSGDVSPLDALVVINQINQSNTAGNQASSSQPATRMVDVNADGSLSPLDALGVINQINSKNTTAGTNLRRPSMVEVERRIERIEKVLEDNVLPPNMTREQATQVLDVLRAGGRPELGDRIVNGLLQWKSDDNPSGDDSTGDDHESGDDSQMIDESKLLERLERFTDSLAERLASFGVSTEVIQTISAEIIAAHQAGTPMDFPQIHNRLVELGVDANAILPRAVHPERPERPERPESPENPENPERPERPERPEQPERPIMPTVLVTEPIAEALRTRLQRAGVNEQVIETLWKDITDAIAAGAPMDLQAVRSRLEELGVRWDIDHPQPPASSRPRPVGMDALREILPALGRMGINAEVVRTIYTEIRASIANGKPLSTEQIVARLKELGVNLGSAFPAVL